MLFRLIALLPVFLTFSLQPSFAADRWITVASTTSTQNSGLFDDILPRFTAQSGIEVRVVAVGTGQAVRMAENGDADVLFVHHRASEEKFVANGFGVQRFDVMYNDFVLVGPLGDPAKIKGDANIASAMGRIAGAGALFASRGDDSGTNKKELELWAAADVEAKGASGEWYRETGSGMGATLNAASAMGAYALTDRGTWLSFNNRGDLTVLSEGDARLFNPYGVILVSAAVHPHVKSADGQTFVDWLVSETGQAAITAYRRGGEQLFFANAQ